jgi:hypothetical protein
MAKEPGDRYRTAADLASDLRAAIAPVAPVKRGRVAVSIAIAAGVLAVAFLVTYLAGAWPFNSSAGLVPETPKGQPNLVAGGSPRIYPTIRLDRRDGSGGILAPEHEPLRPGDGLNLKLYLDPEGFVYVFLYTQANGKTAVERLYPSATDQQTSASNIAIPDANTVFDLKMNGPEMILIAASRTALSDEQLKEFENLVPARLDKNFEGLWQHPRRAAERHRAQTRPLTVQDPDAEKFRAALETLFQDDFLVRIFPNK